MFLLLVLLLSSCGEFIEFDAENGEAASIKLKRNNIDLMVGDTYVIPATFEPADLANQALYWLSDNTNILDLKGDTLVAVGAGKTFVTATVVAGMVTDTCWVTVHPYWEVSPKAYQYDMVVYAHVTSNGHEMDDSIRVGAFIGGQLCGVGQLRRWGNTDYTMLRIYSESGETDQVTLRCYDLRRLLISEKKDVFRFNGETIGTLTQLYDVAFE